MQVPFHSSSGVQLETVLPASGGVAAAASGVGAAEASGGPPPFGFSSTLDKLRSVQPGRAAHRQKSEISFRSAMMLAFEQVTHQRTADTPRYTLLRGGRRIPPEDTEKIADLDGLE